MFQYFTPSKNSVASAVSEPTPATVPVEKSSSAAKLPKREGGTGPVSRRKLSYSPKHTSAKSRRNKVNFKNALFKVLRKIDPAGTISSKAMDVLNDMMGDILERLASEAASLRSKAKKATITSIDIQSATRLTLPGSLSMHAFYEGHRAVRMFFNKRNGDC